MKTLNKALTVKEIRNSIKENDVIGYDFHWINGIDTHFLTVNGKRTFGFINPNDRRKTLNKAKRIGLGLGWKAPLLTDEEEGIIQAGKNGENPFAYTIMCANPELNEIVK